MGNFKKDPPPDKKSFLLYCDQSELIQKLSDEQAGNLIKQIYSYCGNGRKRPEITDPLTDIVFTALQTSLDRDYIKYTKIVERNRNNGQLGGRPKKNPVGSLGTQKTQTNPKNPSEPDSDSDSDSDSVKDKKNIYTSTFESFWKAYPRKIGKGKAFQNYKNIKQPKPSLQIILSSVESQNKSEQWQDKKFIPHPATWLSQRRWDDEIEPLNGNSGLDADKEYALKMGYGWEGKA